MKRSMLDADRLRQLLGLLTDELEGEWLLVGGALVALWLDRRRTTEELDLVGVDGTSEDRFRLLEFASRHGLPVETVNTSADYHVRQIADWRDHLTPYISGALGTIHRPSPTLFLLLKARRLSEQDLADCKLLLERCRLEGLTIDKRRLLRTLDQLDDAGSPCLADRRQQLRAMLKPGGG